MKIAIITVAGISSRFNKGIPEAEHVLKAVYYREDMRETLLYHLLVKCAFADRIVVVGGYRFDELLHYAEELQAHHGEVTVHVAKREAVSETRETTVTVGRLLKKVQFIQNDHFEDLASGYSLYLGIDEALRSGATEILFAEGDLDVDDDSFRHVVRSENSVLTYNHEPVYANKAVVLYQNAEGKYRYAFNSAHGLLSIDEPFSCLLNSGQIWKFTDMDALRKANEAFYNEQKDGTNLYIIRKYLDAGVPCSLVGLERWTNCNTREDYETIAEVWKKQRKKDAAE